MARLWLESWVAGAAGGKLLSLYSAVAGRSLNWGSAAKTGAEAGMVKALPAQRQPRPIMPRLSVSPRNGLCSRHLSPAQLQGQQVAWVSLGERLSRLKVHRGFPEVPRTRWAPQGVQALGKLKGKSCLHHGPSAPHTPFVPPLGPLPGGEQGGLVRTEPSVQLHVSTQHFVCAAPCARR